MKKSISIALVLLVLFASASPMWADNPRQGLAQSNQEVKFRGTVVGFPEPWGFGAGGANVEIDEVLSDPTGNLEVGDTATVAWGIYPPFHTISPEVGDRVEVYGRYGNCEDLSGWSGLGEHCIFLEDSEHHYLEILEETIRVKFRGTVYANEWCSYGEWGNCEVDAVVDEILEDPEGVLEVGAGHAILYQDSHAFEAGDCIEVYGTLYELVGIVVGGPYGFPGDYIEECDQAPKVKCRGTASCDEWYAPQPNGNYFIDIVIDEILEDPQGNLEVGQIRWVGYQDQHNFSTGDCLEVYGTFREGGIVVGGQYGSPEDYIHECAADLELSNLLWTPATPVAFESTSLILAITNVGNSHYEPLEGHYQVEVVFRETAASPSTLEFLFDTEVAESLPRLDPDRLGALNSGDGTTVTVSDIRFPAAAQGTIEVRLIPKHNDANPNNNSYQMGFLVAETPHGWIYCIGAVAKSLYILLAPDPVLAFKTAAVLDWERDVILLCNGNMACIVNESGQLFGEDLAVGITVPDAHVRLIITVVKTAIELVHDWSRCLSWLVQYILDLFQELNRRGIEVNATVAASPVNVLVTDIQGGRAGFLDDGSVVQEIEDAQILNRDGTKIVLYPGSDTATVRMKGTATGTCDLRLALSRGGGYAAKVEYLNVPVTSATVGTVDAQDENYLMEVDENGDGIVDSTRPPDSIITVTSVASQPGWNLISLPLVPTDTPLETVLSSISGNYDLVYAYDGCDSADPWKRYDVNAPPYANDLTDLDEKMGIWIRVTDTSTLTVWGQVPTTIGIQLCEGWNLVGYPSAQAKPIADALSSIEGKYTLVYAYDASDTAAPWKRYDVNAPPYANDLTEMHSGLGYWIKVSEACVLTVSN